jgi:hypothetical protein
MVPARANFVKHVFWFADYIMPSYLSPIILHHPHLSDPVPG